MTERLTLSLFHFQGVGRRSGELPLNGHRAPVWGGKVLEEHGGDGCTAL